MGTRVTPTGHDTPTAYWHSVPVTFGSRTWNLIRITNTDLSDAISTALQAARLDTPIDAQQELDDHDVQDQQATQEEGMRAEV